MKYSGKSGTQALLSTTWAIKKAQSCGIILADTKFEFGTDAEGKVYLIDEVLTPDSSRYWPADKYEVGRSQPSYDKQYVRDWLETLDWNKQAPGPVLPPEVVQNTIKCYSEALSKLMESKKKEPPRKRRFFYSFLFLSNDFPKNSDKASYLKENKIFCGTFTFRLDEFSARQ